MTAAGWSQAVREQLGLGRLLPLGGVTDGAWVAERAAAGVLRWAAAGVAGVRITRLRLGLADPEGGWEPPVVKPPASALSPGPLRVEARCDAAVERPMTLAADELRTALWRAAEERVGLDVAAVDVHIAGLLEEDEQAADDEATDDSGQDADQDQDADPGAGAGLDVPGVLSSDVTEDGDHAEARIAVSADHRALDVARAVRDAVPARTVAVLVTDIR